MGNPIVEPGLADAATSVTVSRDGVLSGRPDNLTDAAGDAGRYGLGVKLGAGGGGVVVEATDFRIGRTVALKTLKPGTDSVERVRRFREEAWVTARLEHPNIIPVYDAGVLAEDRPYYTMRKVQRHSLRDVLRRPPPRDGWPLARLCGVLVQVCHAVAYAHAHGILHRDLKPDNILLGAFGEVYVADWGIAKLVAERAAAPAGAGGDDAAATADPADPDATGDPDEASEDQTRDGIAVGTVGYMAPEQLRGEWRDVDARTDLFAIGVILYEILCDRHPFRIADASASRGQVLWAAEHREPPAPRAIAPGTPLILEQLCVALLAKRKEDRPASAELVAAELEAFLEGAKEKERRRREAARLVEAAAEPLRRHDELGETRRRLLEQAAVARNGMKAWEPLERKRPAWQLEDRAAEVEGVQAKVLAEAMELYQHALAHDPDSAVAHAALADLCWTLARKADAERREPTRIYYEEMVRDHDDGRYAALLAADARLSLRSDPPGAEVVAYRYAEVDRVLRPVDAQALGPTPIHEVRLAPGSYLLVLRHPGKREVRYPIRCRRGDHHDGAVNLYTDAEIGDGFIYVPGGASIIGGDDEARGQPLPRTEVGVADFAIATLPITFAEYLAFLDDLDATDPAACQRRLPVGKDGRMPVRKDEHGRWTVDYDDLVEGAARRFCPPELASRIPMMPLSWFDACAYAAWRSARDGVQYRLPREAEYEKAARGLDERIYPWGNRFDATFCKMRESRPAFSQPEPAGAFPLDESPYGVRDLGGGMAAWMGDLHGEQSLEAAADAIEPPADSPYEVAPERFHRGGSWLASAEACRSASRVRYFGSFRPSECGMRLARSLGRSGG